MTNLDPELADRVAELIAVGRKSGDAIGLALWERDHRNDPNPWYGDEK